MTARPPRDLRAEAHDVFSRRLAREGCRVPDLLATELLAILDGHRIGLTDTRPPSDPNADPRHRPTDIIPAAAATEPSPGLAEYLAAKATRATTPTHRPQKGQP